MTVQTRNEDVHIFLVVQFFERSLPIHLQPKMLITNKLIRQHECNEFVESFFGLGYFVTKDNSHNSPELEEILIYNNITMYLIEYKKEIQVTKRKIPVAKNDIL